MSISASRFGNPHRIVIALATAAASVLLAIAPIQSAQADSQPTNPQNPQTPTTVSADALPTAQVNGVVWAQAVVGNTVYAGGNFTTATTLGGVSQTRSNLLSYNLNTGELTNFAPTFNGQVLTLAASPDGGRLYVGGQFTTVNGETRSRLAVFNTTNDTLVSGFAPNIGYDVSAIAVTSSTIYVGGDFQNVGVNARIRLAAFTTAGALLPWAPEASDKVWSLAANEALGKVAVGGEFLTVNGSSAPGAGLALVDGTTGASLPTPVNSVIKTAGGRAAITTLTSDGNNFYGGGYSYGDRTALEGVFSAKWSDGTLKWVDDCHGDVYSVYSSAEAIYSAGHAHYCGNIDGWPQTDPWTFYRGLAFGKAATSTVTQEPYGYANYEGHPASSLLGWFPRINAGTFTGLSQGPWSVVGNDDYVAYAGEFTKVNGVSQQGLVRFPRAGLSPNKVGPTLFDTTYPLTLTSPESGVVRLRWLTNRDNDNEFLTYKVYRDQVSASSRIYSSVRRSRFWESGAMFARDTGLTPGATHRYRVQVTDPFGNVANSPWVSITVANNGSESRFVRTMLNTEPDRYWRLGESSGAFADSAQTDALNPGTSITRGVTGTITGDSNSAIRLNSAANTAIAASTAKVATPKEFSISGWFSSSSTTGGRLVGFSTATTGTSNVTDRNVYLGADGRLNFGIYRSPIVAITSPSAYNNGSWHHFAATGGQGGLKLYVDGQLVASRADVIPGTFSKWGWWRIGGDSLSGWPNRGSSDFAISGLDEVAVHGRALKGSEVSALYISASGANAAPHAAFSSQTSDLAVAFDAGESADYDGRITSYSWDFGDGLTGSGVTPQHTYASAGDYQVSLTVTDNDGDSTTITRTATALPGNTKPKARFTSAVTRLTVDFDGSNSSDSDGTVKKYLWDFGDGTTDTGATVRHEFPDGGDYPVKLTVTDNDGANDSVTHTVTAVTPTTWLLDGFGRSVNRGWGSADVGGAWVRNGSATAFSVDGGTGKMRIATPGSGVSASLPTGVGQDVDSKVSYRVDKLVAGGSYFTIEPRVVGTDAYYSQARVLVDGQVSLSIGKRAGSTKTSLSSVTVPRLNIPADRNVAIRTQVVGTSPTVIRTKVWLASQPEPSQWTLSASDTTAALQTSGKLGVASYVSGSASLPTPLVFSIARVWAGELPG